MKPEEILIQRLVAMFGEPRTEAPAMYLKEFEKALSGYDARVLELAGDRVIRESVFWPKPAEVVAIARVIAADLQAKQRKPEHRPIETNNASPEERARVKDLVRLALMGMRAKELPEIDRSVVPCLNRDEFEAMQRNSPNKGLHRRRD